MYLLLLTFTGFLFAQDINCFVAFDNKINHKRVAAAYELARDYHFDQFRKIEARKYIVHPDRVAKKVYELTNDEDLLIAALLHDTLEDTKIVQFEIQKIFGKRVTEIVKELTSDASQIKRIGKTLYLSKKLNSISSDALTIKLVDRLDNLADLKLAKRSWARKYSKETRSILNNLNRPLNIEQRSLIFKIRKAIL